MPIEVEVSNGTVLVRDHGPGIDEEDLPTCSSASIAPSKAADYPAWA
jgi:hypothetical protein